MWRGGLYKVGVGVSLIGRMRWTAAAREGREERDSISLPTSECPYPSCGSHATARARTLARTPTRPRPLTTLLTHTLLCFVYSAANFLPSFLPSFPRPPKNAHPRLSGSSGLEYARSLSQWTSTDRCWITTTRWR